MIYIEDMKDGDNILGHYFCREKQSMKTKAGKSYLSLKLSDKTGTIDAKVWEMHNGIQAFEAGDYIKIDGSVTSFQNGLQLRVAKIRKSDEGEYLPADYVPATDKDVNALYERLTDYIKTIASPYIKRMLENIFVNDAEAAEKFKASPAAKTYHHTYMGGLLEHTLSVVASCDFMSGRYKYLNRDVLIAAAMLHDFCKIYELTGFPENDYTDGGQLIGHIVMGAELVANEAAKIPGFPKNHILLLKHCILAHHGEFEFGSPKLPSTIEAFILYCCDNMDAKLNAFETAIGNDKTTGNWAGYSKMLTRNVRKSE